MAGQGGSWQNQGRQEHGWFGHGTSPDLGNSSPARGLFGPGRLDERAAAVSCGSLAALPRSLRRHASALHEFGAAKRLQTLLARWSDGLRLSQAAFASRFFGRGADDKAVQALRAAAQGLAAAKDHDGLRHASERVAAAMQAVGLDSWQRFLADAQARADDPATRAAVAASLPQPTPPPARPAAGTAAMPTASPAAATEPERGPIWQWLHGLGLAKTRHEQATELRRVMGSQGGLVYMRDGAPLNVDQMSDDEVLALDKETRGQPHGPPLIGAAAPVMTPWGWDNTPPYQKALNELKRAGTHETLNGRVPTLDEAIRMIEDSGGKFLRKESPHRPGRSTHTYYHVNYAIANGDLATVRVQAWE